jgi:hypothetical protein
MLTRILHLGLFFSFFGNYAIANHFSYRCQGIDVYVENEFGSSFDPGGPASANTMNIDSKDNAELNISTEPQFSERTVGLTLQKYEIDFNLLKAQIFFEGQNEEVSVKIYDPRCFGGFRAEVQLLKIEKTLHFRCTTVRSSSL